MAKLELCPRCHSPLVHHTPRQLSDHKEVFLREGALPQTSLIVSEHFELSYPHWPQQAPSKSVLDRPKRGRQRAPYKLTKTGRGESWTPEEETQLFELFHDCVSWTVMSRRLHRQETDVRTKAHCSWG